MKTRESGMPGEPVWSAFFDAEAVLRTLGLRPNSGDVVDFGCGYGTFAIPAAGITRGTVHAFDIDPVMVSATQARAEVEGRANVVAGRRDLMAEGTGLPNDSIGYAMLFNILHCEQPGVLLREAWRVLAPGGVVAILEFSQPPNAAFAALYNFYSRRVLPRIGGALSGSPDAYTYLPESVRKFPTASDLASRMRATGFDAVEFEYLTGGIVALHIGVRKAER